VAFNKRMTSAPTPPEFAICESFGYEPTIGAPLYELMNRYSDAPDIEPVVWTDLPDELLNTDPSSFA
jgi:hypothetical protein